MRSDTGRDNRVCEDKRYSLCYETAGAQDIKNALILHALVEGLKDRDSGEAGLKKDVWSYLFRHTTLTKMAKVLTETQLEKLQAGFIVPRANLASISLKSSLEVLYSAEHISRPLAPPTYYDLVNLST